MKIAVLISGAGRSLENLLAHISEGKLNAEIVLVIASRADAHGLEYAKKNNIPAQVISAAQFSAASVSPSDLQHNSANNSVNSVRAMSEKIFSACEKRGAELVVLAGYLKRLEISPAFVNRVVNIHPSLIPAFCGHGFYGARVHQAVIDYGAKVTGCTVHFVDDEYDHGAVILQRVVEVRDDDSAETLAARVFEAEKIALPEAIELIAQQKIHVVGRRVVQKTFLKNKTP